MNWKRLLSVVVACLFLVPTAGFAGRFGGGSRPSFSRPSAPRPSTPSRSTWSRPSAPRPETPHATPSARPARSAPAPEHMSAADRALKAKVGVAGSTVFKTRAEATAAFRQKYGTQYTAHFDREPTVRPAYIPATYKYQGRPVTVLYNPVYHGYGYMWGPVWHPYDPLSDPYVMARLMTNHGYAVAAPSAQGGSVLLMVLFGIAIILMLCVLFYYLSRP